MNGYHTNTSCLTLRGVLFGGLVLLSSRGEAQDTVRTIAVLRAVARSVTENARFRFVDGAGGKLYDSPALAPPGVKLTLENGFNDWRYWNGVLLIGLMRAGDVMNDASLPRFARDDAAFMFDNEKYFRNRYAGESKWLYPFAQRFIMEELDDCGAMGAGLIEVYRLDPQKRYGAYIDTTADFLANRLGRLGDGTIVRPVPAKWTIWADDLYMSVAFLSRLGELSGDAHYFDDASAQVAGFHRYLFDEASGLMHHCWYSDPPQPGVAYWGRANGWALLAQVDLLDRLPVNYPRRAALVALLRKHILGIARYQGPEGLWHQLIDRPDSYLETSCSAMFTYAVARAVNRGYIEPRYAAVARSGWEGVMSRISGGGVIEGVCEGTAVGDDLVFYYHRPTPKGDPHGTGAVLLAGAEILALDRRGIK